MKSCPKQVCVKLFFNNRVDKSFLYYLCRMSLKKTYKNYQGSQPDKSKEPFDRTPVIQFKVSPKLKLALKIYCETNSVNLSNKLRKYCEQLVGLNEKSVR